MISTDAGKKFDFDSFVQMVLHLIVPDNEKKHQCIQMLLLILNIRIHESILVVWRWKAFDANSLRSWKCVLFKQIWYH